jgi:uncharacterized delta-60 repeat protein
MKKNISTTKAFLLALCFAFPLASFSQDGSLDNTFGVNGIVTTSFGSGDNYANATAIQADGKIVLAGESFNSNGSPCFALTRYNTNGSLDNSFGNSGIVTTSFGSGESYANDMAIQTDGKIVVAGESDNSTNSSQPRFTLTRYNTNGNLDNTFGTAGIVITSFVSEGFANAMAIQADGKILATGEGGNSANSIALTRYNINGSLDNTFGIGGIVTTLIGTSCGGYAIDIQADGKIVVAGYGLLSNNQFCFALTRYNTNGSLDNTFGTAGIVTTIIGGAYSSFAYALAIQADGKIVVAGDNAINNNQDVIALTRYNINGSLDNTFGTGGIVTTLIGTSCRARALAIQADGKIVVAVGSNNHNFTLLRYNTNGSLDNTFGTAGIITTVIGIVSAAADIAIQADGKIVAAGGSGSSASSNGGVFTVVRYNNSLTGDISENSNNTSQISIYPNPFSKATTLKTDNIFENATFIVYNTLGEQVRKIDNISGQTFTFYRDNLDEGIYFYHLKENNKMLSVDKLIICD